MTKRIKFFVCFSYDFKKSEIKDDCFSVLSIFIFLFLFLCKESRWVFILELRTQNPLSTSALFQLKLNLKNICKIGYLLFYEFLT